MRTDDTTYSIAEKHPREPTRQATLDRLRILDTPEEEEFESIVEIAAELMGVPMTAISFVDRDRQWFKAQRGLPVRETPRSVAFCAHAILGDGPFVVGDTTVDRRFAGNPLVTDQPAIRSYAGVPLGVDSREPLGTLCVIDTVPREFSPSQLAALSALARQVESQLALRETVRELADANESLRHFTSVASHDLRAPVRNIRDLVDFIREDGEGVLDATARGHLDMIEGRADAMSTLIEDLTDYARAGSFDRDLADARPAEVIDDVLDHVALAPGPGCHVHIDPLAADRLVPRVAATLCLRNLVSNALAHASGPDSTCRIEVTDQPRGVRFSVIDDGPGIAPEFHARIFEPFQRLQPDATKTGSGIGLAIVRRTARAHGGEVDVRSTPGEGSTFFLDWPAA